MFEACMSDCYLNVYFSYEDSKALEITGHDAHTLCG